MRSTRAEKGQFERAKVFIVQEAGLDGSIGFEVPSVAGELYF